MLLKDLLAVIHLHTKLVIMDITTDVFIEDTDDFDGYDDFAPYVIEGVRITAKSQLMILVKPI